MGKSKESAEKVMGEAEEKSDRRAHEPAAEKANGQETESLRRELIEDLTRLRPLLREVADKYVARLEAELFQIGEALRNRDVSEAPGRVRRGLAQMHDEVGALGLRPEKARRKDLKKIEDFLEETWETLSGW